MEPIKLTEQELNEIQEIEHRAAAINDLVRSLVDQQALLRQDQSAYWRRLRKNYDLKALDSHFVDIESGELKVKSD